MEYTLLFRNFNNLIPNLSILTGNQLKFFFFFFLRIYPCIFYLYPIYKLHQTHQYLLGNLLNLKLSFSSQSFLLSSSSQCHPSFWLVFPILAENSLIYQKQPHLVIEEKIKQPLSPLVEMSINKMGLFTIKRAKLQLSLYPHLLKTHSTLTFVCLTRNNTH